MTIAEILAYVRTKNHRTDKDDVIMRGINWVKNDLCSQRTRKLFKRGTMTLVPGQTIYTQGVDGLPSDFQMIDKILFQYTTTHLYELKESDYIPIEGERVTSGYPSLYHITSDNDIYIGYPKPANANTVRLYYYYKVSDYVSTDTTTPVFAGFYGDELYIWGAEFYLWDDLEMYERSNRALELYESEKAKAHSQEESKAPPFIRPNLLY